MKKAYRDQFWRGVTEYLVTDLRGTEVSERGGVMIPLEPSERRGIWKKPKRLRVGTGQYNVLKWIWQGGEEGRRYTDIQLYLIGGEEAVERGPQSKVNPRVWDYQRGEYRPGRVNPLRGHYSTWLSYYMPHYCTKLENGRWVLTEPALIRHFNNVVK